MTGLELLKEEMEKRGCLKSQIESKVVPIILDIVSQSGNTYTATCREEAHLKEIEQKITWEEHRLSRIKHECESIQNEIKNLKGERNTAYREVAKDVIDYIDNFNKALQEAETPEARDRLRTAQVFVNSVNVDTKYDNTAFIVALASLLTGLPYSPVKELKKINKKININKYGLNDMEWDDLEDVEHKIIKRL